MFSATPSVSSLHSFLRSLARAHHLANALLARTSFAHSHRQKIMPRQKTIVLLHLRFANHAPTMRSAP
jgi:hypothetical protein